MKRMRGIWNLSVEKFLKPKERTNKMKLGRH